MKAQAARPAATASPSPAAVQAARASFAKLPLSFEENVGQTDGRVKYMSRGSGYNLFLTADQAVFALRDGSALPNCTGLSRKIAQDCARPSNQRTQESVLWLKMVGANSSAHILGSDLLPGKINYYVGNDPSKWRTGVRQFGRVSYRWDLSGRGPDLLREPATTRIRLYCGPRKQPPVNSIRSHRSP